MRAQIFTTPGKNIELEECMYEVTLIIKSIIGYKTIPRLVIGNWPMASFNFKNKQTCIYLPFKKKGREYYDKLKMFAAHEAGHIAYTYVDTDLFNKKNVSYPEYVKNNLDAYERSIENYIDDIRIESAIMNNKTQAKALLPMTFVDFRQLLNEQMESPTGNPEKLLAKLQWYLMGMNYIINENLEEEFQEEIVPIVFNYYEFLKEASLSRISFEASALFEEQVTISKQITAYLRKAYPKITNITIIRAPKKDKFESIEEDNPLPDFPQPNSITIAVGDNESEQSKNSGLDVDPGALEEAIRKAQQEGLFDDMENNEQDIDDSLIPKEGANEINSVPIAGGSGEEGDSFEDGLGLVKESDLKDVQDVLKGVVSPVSYKELPTTGALVSKKNALTIKNKYSKAITEFGKLFAGGWRAPRRHVSKEKEFGDLDTDQIFKIKMKGKDKTMYESRRLQQVPGLNVLVMLDGSGSMSSYVSQIIESGFTISYSKPRDVKMKTVVFTNTCFVLQDYDDKSSLLPEEHSIKNNMGSTPLGESLANEYRFLMRQRGDKFLVIVSDGSPDNRELVDDQLNLYKKQSVTILFLQFGNPSSAFKDKVDYFFSYKDQELIHLPKLLSRDIQSIVKKYAKKSLQTII